MSPNEGHAKEESGWSAETAHLTHSLTPCSFVDHAEDFVAFLVRGLGGSEIQRTLRSDGRIARADVRFGTNTVAVSEASSQFPAMAASYWLLVDAPGTVMTRAVRAGAQRVDETPWGQHQAGVLDGWGNIWWIAQRVESADGGDRFTRGGGQYLPEMYADRYFPLPQVDQLKTLFQKFVRFLESKRRTLAEVKKACDTLTREINDLEVDFEAAGSQIETAARDDIGDTLGAIFSVYGINFDVEEALRLRAW